MLDELDNMMQAYLIAVSSRSVAINTSIVNATAKALIQKYPDIVCNINIDSSSFAKNSI